MPILTSSRLRKEKSPHESNYHFWKMTVVPAVKRRRLSPQNLSEDQSSSSTLVAQSDEPSSNDFFTNAARWNLEQDYEQRPRKKAKKEKESTRLPIKTAEGRVEQLQVQDFNDQDQDSVGDSDGNSTDELNIPAVVEEEKPKIPVRQQIIEAKEELARVASLINENPEEHAGAFSTLTQIVDSANPTIKKLALVTQLAVFKDVIPGYRIRPITESDMGEKLSKEVRRLRAFEQALVGSYQTYVKDLAKYAKTSSENRSEGTVTVSSVAISCACALILAVPHFNFRTEVLKILVNKLSVKKIDADFRKCREAIETLFRDDEDGNASLDAVTMLTKMMKGRNYRIDESVLNTFLHLRLLSEFSSKASQNQVDKPTHAISAGGKKPKFKKEFRTKKQRKQLKERKIVEKEFREADALVSHEERDRRQAETLKIVFVTYFRILKARFPTLMGPVLEGLAKYAHLINQDFFGDLLEALKDLISSTDTAPTTEPADEEDSAEGEADEADDRGPSTFTRTRSTLLCITTAFALLAGQDASRAASSLNLDLTFFTTHLYRLIPSLALDPDLELDSRKRPLRLPDPHSPFHHNNNSTNDKKVNLRTTPALFLLALSLALTPRTTPPLRCASFTKRLLTASLHLPPKSASATLALLGAVLRTHGRKVGALWDTEETRGDGVFAAGWGGGGWVGGGDPDGGNPFAAQVWEGELLRLHFCPRVREGVRALEKGVGGKR